MVTFPVDAVTPAGAPLPTRADLPARSRPRVADALRGVPVLGRSLAFLLDAGGDVSHVETGRLA
ncbi:hypothetical protein [Dactylosporangium sp. NPDC005555]|uniref:hypothetical protein n=1 Tax=Dactylosporangium sp. NPDC005555 TaxID=3154889 RepID=UPI0033A5D7EB